MVNEWFCTFVCGEVKLDEDSLHVQEVTLEGIEESPGLQVLGGSTTMRKETVQENDSATSLRDFTTYTEIPSSLMIYPIPYPSAATGPNPNNLNAGLPQFDVERMDVFKTCQPGSKKISGRGGRWT